MFRNDGKILATGSWDKTTRLWDMPAPLEEDVEQLVRSVQVATGLELDAESFAP
jgi:WD40 repeat protein